MKTTIQNHISLLLAAALLLSCDGFSSASVEVDVEVDDMTQVLVINGEIEYDATKKQGKPAWVQISYTEDINALVTTPVKYENAATVTLTVNDGRSEVLKLVTTAAPASDAGVGAMNNSNDAGSDQGTAPDSGQPDAGADQGAAPDSAAAPDSSSVPDAGKGKLDAGKGKPDAGKGKPDAGKGKPDAGKGTSPYANKGLYVGSSILGEEGKTYTLTVKVGADTYTANCEMFKEPGIGWFVINGMSNKGQYITTSVTSAGANAKSKAGGYAEEWKVLDPAATRNRYMFEYYVNGTHLVAKDWAIDDNRVVNSTDFSGEGLKLFNITINPSANQYLTFRVSEIDKPTYDYYNMYEKIVRGLIGVGSVTPYNPKSNFSGKRTVGNFRAVSFSSTPGLAPPTPCTVTKGGAVKIQFARPPMDATNMPYFTKYHLYTGTATGVDHKSTKISNIKPTAASNIKNLTHTITSPATGANYFRLQVEDKDGFVSPLSPEVTADTAKDVDNCGGGTTPAKQCGDLKAPCNPKTDLPCLGKDGKTYECTGKGVWTEQKSATGTMTCGGVTKQCKTIINDAAKGKWCQDENGTWWNCKDGKWTTSKGK